MAKLDCKKLAEMLGHDPSEISDGFHTFGELYEFRMLYNALLFNEWAENNKYNVHKSLRHSDGERPFGKDNWFIVVAILPTGQISNHYLIGFWDLFKIPEVDKALKYDGHTTTDVINRMELLLMAKDLFS